VAALNATAVLGSQLESWLKFPVTKMFSPNTVVAVTAKVTATVGPPVPGWHAPVGALIPDAPQVAGTMFARRSNAVTADA
jgi:hypothetical protein